MAPLNPRRSPGVGGLDPIATTWGGLVASIGLMVGAGRDWPLRLSLAALSFGIGGFLSGVRAEGRRIAHAAGAWVAAYVIHAAFVMLAIVIGLVGGPDAPELARGGARDWLIAAGWALVFALGGGAVADNWLRPASRRRNG